MKKIITSTICTLLFCTLYAQNRELISNETQIILQNKQEEGNKLYWSKVVKAGNSNTTSEWVTPYTIEPGAHIVLKAERYIRLSDGFRAKKGCFFRAMIEKRINALESILADTLISDSSIVSIYEAKGQVEKINKRVTEVEEDQYPTIKVYPNPTKDLVYVSFENTKQQTLNIFAYNNAGQTVFTRKIEIAKGYVNQELTEFNSLPMGNYILNICLDSKCKSFKILKKN